MATVGIFDSGAGGLSVLKELKKSLQGASFIYFSDNANCPYGNRPAEFIIGRSRKISELLIGKGADIIVVACNTATSAAIKTLREEFPIPFVGMEPAVKPAVADSRTGVIGVLATAGTLKGVKYLDNRSLYEKDVRIVEHVGEGFVELVERGELDGPRAEEICRKSLEPLLSAGADRIVLGCTHYPFLIGTLQKVASEICPDRETVFIDPAPAVAKRTAEVLASLGKADGSKGTVELLSSGPSDTLKALASGIL